jgi:propionate CoA-transferase
MVQKVISAEDAVSLIRDGDTVAISGFVGIGTPEELIIALEKRFLETGHPRDLTLVFAAAPGDGADRGVNRLAHEGLVKRAVGGHWALVPKLSTMAVENKIEAYNLPLGCVSQLFRVIAGGKPGLRTKVGLKTFVDPRVSGGKINALATEDLVELDIIKGEEWLFYKAFPIDVCLLRGTTSDAHGNTTSEREALTLDVTSIAMATHNSDGLVIVQVERMAQSGSLAPKRVLIPGALVDCVVKSQTENHHQTFGTSYEHAFSGEMRVPLEQLPTMPMDERKIMARRAAMELPMGGVVNLGIGIPEGVAKVAAEEDMLDKVILSAEAGTIGGMPQGGLDFGASLNPDAIVSTNSQFDFYDGGGLDMACLGMAQADMYGNVNVSRFGKRLAGAGGFINISQNASRLVLTGAFTASGLQVAVEDGKLRILQEGKVKKFVRQVEHITFSGQLAVETGQPVLYVTERCVFGIGPDGLELLEVAPGIDVERDILPHMEFTPIMRNIKTMDARIFQEGSMALLQSRTEMPIEQRIMLDRETGKLVINLRSMKITSRLEILQLKQAIENVCESYGRPVDMMAVYDGFEIKDNLQDEYADMIGSLDKAYYYNLVHYTRDPFIRLKFGAELKKRHV